MLVILDEQVIKQEKSLQYPSCCFSFFLPNLFVFEGTTHLFFNLRVVQNGMFVINPVYFGGDAKVAKILDFRFSESLKMCSPGPFALPDYP